MSIQTLTLNHYPLVQALTKLAEFTGREWSREELYDAVNANGLPVHSAPPYDVRVAAKSMGELIDGAIGWRLALLLPHQIEQLRYTGMTATRTPAWKEGDLEYQTLDWIKQQRPLVEHAQASLDLPQRHATQGTWMGESERFFFPCNVLVTDQTVQVPAETLRELLRLAQVGKQVRYGLADESGTPTCLHGQRHEMKSEQQDRHILTWLVDNGFDPMQLPRAPAGTPGVKSTVRAAMLDLPRVFSDKSFEKAWARLRADGHIADQGAARR